LTQGGERSQVGILQQHAEDDTDNGHRDDRSAPDQVVAHRRLAPLDQIDRAKQEDDRGEDIGEVGEIAEEVEHVEAMLDVDHQLRDDSHQRQRAEEQPPADENAPFAHSVPPCRCTFLIDNTHCLIGVLSAVKGTALWHLATARFCAWVAIIPSR
jgi:hypothetical protein